MKTYKEFANEMNTELQAIEDAKGLLEDAHRTITEILEEAQEQEELGEAITSLLGKTNEEDIESLTDSLQSVHDDLKALCDKIELKTDRTELEQETYDVLSVLVYKTTFKGF